MNNIYKITVEHPLVRPGLTIETEASENYIVKVVNTLMKNVRVINDQECGALTFRTTNEGVSSTNTSGV